MFFLDAAVLVGVLLILTKVADLALRPHQQARLQTLVESATLKLSYTSMITAARHLARRHIWRLVLLVVALVPLQMYVALPMLGQMFARDPRATPEMVGLVVVLLFFAECVAAVPAAFALRWVLRDDSGLRTVVRYGSMLMFLVAANQVALSMIRNDVGPQSRVLQRVFGLVTMAGGSVAAALFIAAWIFALALLLHVLLRASGADRCGSKEGPRQRRQQVIEADIRLPDQQLRGEHAAREPDQQPRRDNTPTMYARTGMPLSAAAFSFAPIA